MAEKEHWWREESITAYPKEEDPISEDSKKTLSLTTLRRIFWMRNLSCLHGIFTVDVSSVSNKCDQCILE